MSSKVKVWVQPVGDLWNIKHLNQVLYRTRTMEEGIKEAKLFLVDILKKETEETLAEIVVESKEGSIKTIIFDPDHMDL